jgi:hypothetical protein
MSTRDAEAFRPRASPGCRLEFQRPARPARSGVARYSKGTSSHGSWVRPGRPAVLAPGLCGNPMGVARRVPGRRHHHGPDPERSTAACTSESGGNEAIGLLPPSSNPQYAAPSRDGRERRSSGSSTLGIGRKRRNPACPPPTSGPGARSCSQGLRCVSGRSQAAEQRTPMGNKEHQRAQNTHVRP